MKNEMFTKGLIGFFLLFFVGCCTTLQEGIYIGQHWSIIEVTDDDSLIVQDVRIDSNSIYATPSDATGYIYQLKGRYEVDSSNLYFRVDDSLQFLGRVDKHNIFFGENSPKEKWSRWYGGETRTDYHMYKSRLVKLMQDIGLFRLYGLALEASAYKNGPTYYSGGKGSYIGFEKYIRKQRPWLMKSGEIFTYVITEAVETITIQANSITIPGAYVVIRLDENGVMTMGPTSSGW